ncbi:MAG: HAD-IA family hydrolase [Pseudomonadales bacterium]|jgi:pseudouridine-5'-monophosphatase|nr:HAD family hydrolase [Gammaproteobacteria bacterium]MDP6024856.1 HAD-IA family hydrolase [Pseudomonadales bacterium]MDP6316426.1 HAD-IA family hydrolase [Pseudomonadales bacterium]MDP7316433.1 HAD-IA family hydrolase [Pseudomonadales bacterium]MDP7577216.1 HAD-IA family hydrolase [Pseudomonadales bacterium]|tara:strand:- start:1180 stop:1857 length:678 start_codon:yes stop_codon:yes gene_type:complete
MSKSLLAEPAAFIFDMDGTLLDTEPSYTIATQQVLDPYNVEFTMELKRRAIGGDSHSSAQLVIDHYNLPLSADEFLAKREVFLRELFTDPAEIPGAGEFIQALAVSDVPIGLATSSHHYLYKLKLSRKSWGNCFDQVVCGDNPHLKHGKPSPDIFLLCARMLHVDPERCIVFEDSPNGVRAAISAGMQVIAISSPYVADGALDNASLVVDSYSDLQQLLTRWTNA